MRRGRFFFYLEEMWTDKNRTFEKCGETDDVKGVLADSGVLDKLKMVNTGSEDGSVAGAQPIYWDQYMSLMFRSGRKKTLPVNIRKKLVVVF